MAILNLLELDLPRYYFDIKDGQDFPDLTGTECEDLTGARLEAIRYSGEVLKEMPERFWNCELWTMTVSDGAKAPIFTLKFIAEPV